MGLNLPSTNFIKKIVIRRKRIVEVNSIIYGFELSIKLVLGSIRTYTLRSLKFRKLCAH